MLKTIHTLGKEISEGRDEWQDIIETKLKVKTKENDRLLIQNIILDLDTNEVIISNDNYRAFDESFETLKELRHLATQGGNFKAVYVCVDASNVDKLAKTLFGKPDKKTGEYPLSGELMQSIEKDMSALMESDFYKMLTDIVPLRENFFEYFLGEKGKFNLVKVNEKLGLSVSNKIVLLYVSVKSEKHGLDNVPLGEMTGYNEFIRHKFFSKKEVKSTENNKQKLCYVSGELKDDTVMAEFSGANRYNINRMFILDKINYSSDFEGKKSYNKNYQLSQDSLTMLERGSDYILQNLTTTIADVPHALIPEFLSSKKITRDRLKSILSDTDLLFNSKKFGEFDTFLGRRTITKDDVYWLNFLTIDSNGNYFKAGNLIKDVSKFHFINLTQTLNQSGKLLSAWLGLKYDFNLNSMYRLVPVRKDNENINQALILFAAVLEQRKIELRKLYTHFTELVLCHWYERYKSFTNVRNKYENFDYAAKDAVYGYMAFIYSLKQLNLIKNLSVMDKEKPKSNIAEQEEKFFGAMDYTSAQKALFFLGKALNRVGYEQEQHKNKKTVLNKINFNGMDKRSIFRLSTDLFEKGTQYTTKKDGVPLLDKIKYNLTKFNKSFDFNSWDMNPHEALFFLLSGYTFNIKSKPKNEAETKTDNK